MEDGGQGTVDRERGTENKERGKRCVERGTEKGEPEPWNESKLVKIGSSER